jgi:hypothetical protein
LLEVNFNICCVGIASLQMKSDWKKACNYWIESYTTKSGAVLNISLMILCYHFWSKLFITLVYLPLWYTVEFWIDCAVVGVNFVHFKKKNVYTYFLQFSKSKFRTVIIIIIINCVINVNKCAFNRWQKKSKSVTEKPCLCASHFKCIEVVDSLAMGDRWNYIRVD